MTRPVTRPLLCLSAVLMLGLAVPTLAQQDGTPPPPGVPEQAAPMDLDTARGLLERLDEGAEATPDGRFVRVTIREREVIFVADPTHNRMRLMSVIRPAEGLTGAEMMRIMQANFDSALDARYAIAQGLLWSVYIHPLRELSEGQFVAAVGQVVNAAESYGTSYSSGLLTFGGGDTDGLRQRQLIDELLEQAEPI